MAKLRNWRPFLGLMSLLIISATLLAACGGDKEKGTIYLMEQDWTGQIVAMNVAGVARS